MCFAHFRFVTLPPLGKAFICHTQVPSRNFERAEIRQNKAKRARSPKAYFHTSRATSRCFNAVMTDLCHSNFGRAEIRQGKAKRARSPKAYFHTSRATSRCFNAVMADLCHSNFMPPKTKSPALLQDCIYKRY